jgi:hypothetical protein
VLEGLRDIAGDNSLCKAFNDRRFPYPGFANKNGIVLGSPGENLYDTPHFFIATNNGIEFALARKFREIP